MDKLTIGMAFVFFLGACSSMPFRKPPCDPSNFNMKTYKGRTAYAWCKVKEDAKKIKKRNWHSKYDMETEE